MQQTTELESGQAARPAEGAAQWGRFFLALLGLIGVLALFWFGFDFLRSDAVNSGQVPAPLVAAIAIIWGVGGVAALFTVANVMVESLSNKWRGRIQPYIFAGPAVAILSAFLLFPA